MKPLIQRKDNYTYDIDIRMETEDPVELNNLLDTNYWTADNTLYTLDIAFRTQLTEASPKVSQPDEILIPLRDHQRAAIAAMEEREKVSVAGIPYHSTRTFTNYGVLGDEVGSGKSLTVLSYIARMKHSQTNTVSKSTLIPSSRSHFFTIYAKEYTFETSTNLIIVPHTIFRQWQEYCKKQTILSVFYVKSSKDIAPLVSFEDETKETRQKLIQTIRAADLVLVSNTLYGELQTAAFQSNLSWRRIFVDEVDTIAIPGTKETLDAPFVWFISATWPNFIMSGQCIRPHLLAHYELHSTKYSPALGTWLRSEVGSSTYGRTTWLGCKSKRWLEKYYTIHKFRGMVLVSCADAFMKQSRSMPQITEQTLLCEQPASHRALSSLVTPTIQAMLHAGNIEGALQELGVTSDTPLNLVDAAKQEREKELDRLKKTLAFKETLDYATPAAKEQALTALRGKIASIEQQMNVFQQRLSSVETEECPICYDNPKQNSATLTPCCHRLFCGTCILTSLTRGLTCPMCRASVNPSQLIHLVETKQPTKKKDVTKILSKSKQLMKVLKETPNGRILVFSRYENPFVSLERECEGEHISYHTLRGNKDVIANTIKSFETGEKRVLFLPLESVGAGINLVTATHVILLHAMTPEEEKQAIGRAYRLGRTEPLQIIRLLHEGETFSNV